jgi:glutamate racemase
LIATYAADCRVTLVGSETLAGLAESFMKGEPVADSDLAREIMPCFVEEGGRRTDSIVLACTHYPLLRERFDRVAPWPVAWFDPAPAIARRVDHVLSERGFALPVTPFARTSDHRALFTSATVPSAALDHALRKQGLTAVLDAAIPVFG